jgi:hypothetical protein
MTTVLESHPFGQPVGDSMRRPHRRFQILVAIVVAGAISTLSAQSARPDEYDQLLGAWSLVVRKSTYSPGPAPTSETRTYVRDGTNILGTIQRTFKDGRRERIEYTANFDREYPVTGTDDYDHVILRRINDFTSEAVLSHAGRVFGTAQRVISVDRKSMTIVFKTDGSAGPAVRNTAYYEKLEPLDPEPR